MDPGERKAWTGVINSEDLDYHLDSAGQAKVNAELLKIMLNEFPLVKKGTLLIAGCGTGQLLDFISPQVFGENLKFIFTDINPDFLEKTRERMKKFPNVIYKTQIDDIENTKLKEKINGVAITLVLEHVEWKKALKSMVDLNPEKIYIIIQKQKSGQSVIAQKIKLRPSIEKYSKIENFKLIIPKELINFMKNNNFFIKKIHEEPTPNEKVSMAGFVFEKE